MLLLVAGDAVTDDGVLNPLSVVRRYQYESYPGDDKGETKRGI